MEKLSKAWVITLSVAGLLTLVFALLALLLYTRTERGVVEAHSKDHKLLARLAATALAQRLDSHLHSVEALAASFRGLPQERWSGAFSELPAPTPSSNILLLGADGTLHFRQPPSDAAAVEAALLPWWGSREPALTSPFPGGAGDREVILLVPLVVGERVVAQIGSTFRFNPMVETLFPYGAAAEHVSLSLLDEDGNVLASTRHPEMVGRRMPPAGQSCLPCHTSFALERRMLKGEAGVDQLQVGSAPLALLAFTPVRILGRRWALSLSEPYSVVIADTRKGFQAISLLLGFSLLVGLVATAVTVQVYAQRRRAEERAKLAERRTALERQMLQNKQLAAMGKMTSQIAHAINTPLAALGLNVSYLQGELARRPGAAAPEIEEVSRAIGEEVGRLKRVVNDYLRFARLPQPALTPTSLREALESFLDFIEPEARDGGVRLEVELGHDPAYTLLDADLFQQAFLNLVRNSFEAMPEGGTLHVHLQREEAELVLRLEDTGSGIPPDTLPHIFDPFFTTKKEGTGLGLAHTRRIVEQHGGSVACWSAPGRGTTFTLRLPVTPASAEKPNEVSLVGKGR